MEHATKRNAGGAPKDIRHIPEFRRFLAHEGLTFAKWQARQTPTDAAIVSMQIQRQKLRAYSRTR